MGAVINMRLPQKLSVVIPVYNEAKRLPQALDICRRAAKANPGWEFIFIDDGSTDSTRKLIQSTQFKLVADSKNQGKGHAIKLGVQSAITSLILITDVDFSTPLSELKKFFPVSADIIIGSRKTKGAQITLHQPWWREWLGRQFTNITNLWLGLHVSDITCGFKLFKTAAAKKLFSLSKINRWGYDAEILFLAKKLGLTLMEVPVVWENNPQSKVSLTKDILRSLKDLWIIKLHHYEV